MLSYCRLLLRMVMVSLWKWQELILHIGPVKVQWTEYNGKWSATLMTSSLTTVYSVDASASDGEAQSIETVADLNRLKTGDKILYQGIALKDVVDGSTFLIDRSASPDYIPIIVGLINCPPSPIVKKGMGVTIEDILYKYDVVRLKCTKIDLDPQPNDAMLNIKSTLPTDLLSPMRMRLCLKFLKPPKLEEESIVAIIHGIERREENLYIVSLMLEEGNGVIAMITHDVWLRWKHLIHVGKVVKFDHGFIGRSFSSNFLPIISAIGHVSSPHVEAFTFSMSKLPSQDTYTAMMVVTWDRVFEPKASSKECAPVIDLCYTRNEDRIYLKVFQQTKAIIHKIQSFTKGSKVHIGSVRICTSECMGRENVSMHTSSSTIFYENLY
ncbi:hypothetical protein PRIPAC_75013 [Pristionchus pacificus]|uniref:Uncharacterized protein n=1 Tax=Pristionchus pacificus TaxID=54126 RepID=A0A2A6BGL9_PRIPA|nr:hypothetical protein PRIPAC_75013 [Pristionchus pacificus]|eukprot:PDM65027.1 hypothetical protein PRIPAC_53283 [Pristionchus pacificus]